MNFNQKKYIYLYIYTQQMVSAADGAEEHYTLENNQARTEDANTARMMDRKTQKAWVGHSHLFVFDNSTDFEVKF